VKEIKFKFETGTEELVLQDRETLKKCLSQPYIYVRIPRTGSTSISTMLRTSRNDNGWPHFYASLLRDLIGQDEYDKRLVFASVRNPWDRLVSWYMFNCNDYRADEQQSKFYRKLGFKNWIMQGCPHHGWRPHHFAHQPKDTISQLSWITDEDGKIIVDKIIRLENLKEDFESIGKELGIQPRPIVKMNISPKRQYKDYRKYYDSESAQKVVELYGDDIRHFKYEF